MKISKALLVISILLVTLLFATSAFAATPTPTKIPTPTPIPGVMYRMNVHQLNTTGQSANDLEIFIKGNVQVLDWWHVMPNCPFQSITYSYDPLTDTTTVRFYDGFVYPNQQVDTCIFLNQNIKEYRLRRWSVDAKPTDAVGATLSVEFRQSQPGTADITISNLAQDGGPSTISVLQIGAAKRQYSFAELLWSNPILDQEITWSVTLQNIHLNINGTITIPAVPMPLSAAGLVYRLKASLDSQITNAAQMEYVAQFTPGIY